MAADARPWPSQSEYIEALQNPATAFVDPTLREAIVEEDIFGLPRPRSGRMASVYKVFAGDRTWALRCFNFNLSERAERYRKISSFLMRHPNPYTVGFEYRDDGIATATASYPTVKMEWVEGDLLHTYLYARRSAPHELVRLAEAWLAMVRDLHDLGIAHGDLQHGNVIVTAAGELRLIDYDGMFVPEFERLPSLERGHPNYQHPCRLKSDFGPHLDNFSAWVVYISIIALARDATLWERLHVGDDRLAFGRDDYQRPSQSIAFNTLSVAGDRDVREMVLFLRSMLAHEPQSLPSLEGGPLVPFARVRMTRGVYVEPFLPKEPPTIEDPVSHVRLSLVIGGGGIAGVLAGYLGFVQLGFSLAEVSAMSLLVVILTALVTFASQGPNPPSMRQK
ncbi:MAG: hypothetical protein NVS3B17_10850 [Vulcanimicrobiaceae bacterium]